MGNLWRVLVRATVTALVYSHFIHYCLHMLILPFNISPPVPSPFFLISLKLKRGQTLARSEGGMIRANNAKKSQWGGDTSNNSHIKAQDTSVH